MISVTTWYRRKAVSGSCIEYSNAVKAEVIDCSGFEDITIMPFSVFPVPSAGNFTIKTESVLPEGSTVSIYNSVGEIVSSRSFTAGQTEMDISLDVSPGLYVIVLSSDRVRGLRKITIE
ncbi:hypothetical protein SDC9_189676 [bioreactor metagenome]|uniref:Secretion system C-terminal sorting domain-containing protein n=1 Tax=bioreactor metagenome TaxID=1076179 RepID=A0A645HTD5_9ZZZZ